MEKSMPTSKPTVFGLLRHGKTEWNSVKRIQGSADSPLTAEGKAKTVEWIPKLKSFDWHRIIASDLGRVKETVALINEGLDLPVSFDTRLREQDWGEWEGLTLKFIKSNFQEELTRRVELGWGFSAPGGETRQQVTDRVFRALLFSAAKWPGENILTVCHQGVIKCALYSITQRAFMPGEDPLLQHNCLHLVENVAGNLVKRQLNIDRHIDL